MKNLVFVIGVPGSRWSGFSNALIALSGSGAFDTSDHAPHRFYQHTTPDNEEYVGATHQGVYFGPGMEFGERWAEKEYITRENLLKDISEVWDLDAPGKKLIKCHQLSLHLHELRAAFPESMFIFVWRPEKDCLLGWLWSGGFMKITYPNYHPYYQNIAVMTEKLHMEFESINDYLKDKGIPLVQYSKEFWDREFGLTLDLEQSTPRRIHKHLGDQDVIHIAIERPVNS